MATRIFSVYLGKARGMAEVIMPGNGIIVVNTDDGEDTHMFIPWWSSKSAGYTKLTIRPSERQDMHEMDAPKGLNIAFREWIKSVLGPSHNPTLANRIYTEIMIEYSAFFN